MPNKLRALAVLWAGLVILVNALLFHYQSTAGDPAKAPSHWPAQSAIRPGSTPTLLMFVHPSCECTESSLREFNRLLTQAANPINAQVVVSMAPGMSEEWVRLHTLKTLLHSDKVRVMMDVGLRETDLFGVKTSGDVLLYSADGRLLFDGGITPSRGHEGAARGQQCILEAIKGQAEPRQTQVYGCPLHTPDEFCSAGARASNSQHS